MIDSIQPTPIVLSESIIGLPNDNYNHNKNNKLEFEIIWPEGKIDLTESILNQEELVDLLVFLKKNIKVGTIKWSENQDRFDYTFCKIIKQLGKNNSKFNYHPSAYICGLIASHVYCPSEIFAKSNRVNFRDINIIDQINAQASQLESINEYLSQLEILRFVNDGGFQYAIYENKEMHHLIMAFRGTSVTNLKEATFTLFEDLVGITMKNKNSFQQNQVFKVVKEAVDICKKKFYHLTIVGHSLGAWLSELAHYDCFYNLNFKHVKTVTFDSPGALDQFKAIDNNVPPKIPYEAMDIVSYLSEPNIVNCMNNHIFENNTTFRIYPEGIEQIDNQKLDFLISTKFHSLGLILNTFDFETGIPKKYKIVKKWPIISFSKMSLYFSYFEKNDNNSLENGNHGLDDVQYHVEESNRYEGFLALDRFAIDQFIHKLSIKNFFSEFNDYFISSQLKELKSFFVVKSNKEEENEENSLQVSIKDQSITYDALKQRVARIVNLNPKEISKVLNSNDQDYIPKNYKIRVEHSVCDGFYDSNDYIGKLTKVHESNNIALLTGEEGSGKTAIALEYALNHFPKSYSVVTNQAFKEYKLLFLRGQSKEMILEDFSNHLLKNFQAEHSNSIIGNGYDFQLSSSNLLDFYKVIMDTQDTFYLFVFDNVEDLSIVEPFLYYLPKLNTKTIITCQVDKRGNHTLQKVLSLSKQTTDEITINVTLLDNKQADAYLESRGIKLKSNFTSPVSVHLLNILINHSKNILKQKDDDSSDEPIDFSKTLSKLIKEFINANPESVNLLNVLPFLNSESISYKVISKINDTTNETIEKFVQYWSEISLINALPGDSINTYKYIQQIILNEIISDSDKQSTIVSLVGVLSNLDLTSSNHPKGWRIWSGHLRFFYDNFKELCNSAIIENLGICYRLSSSYQNSIQLLNEALNMKTKSSNSVDANQDQNDKNEICKTLYQIGYTYQKNVDYSNALKYYHLLLKTTNLQEMIGNTNNQIGFCYYQLGFCDTSLEWYENSLNTAKENIHLSSTHLNLGDYYLDKNEITKAKQEFTTALNLVQQDSSENSPYLVKSHFKLATIEYLLSNCQIAIEKFNETIRLYKQLFKSSLHDDIATSYEMIGLCYLNDPNSVKDTSVLLNSLENLQQSLNIRLKIHRSNLNHKDIGKSYLHLGNCYKKRMEFEQSLNCFKKAYDIQKVNEDNLIPILKTLSTVAYHAKNYNDSNTFNSKIISYYTNNIDKMDVVVLSTAYKYIGENYRLLFLESNNQDLKLKQSSITNFQKSIQILMIKIDTNETNINIPNHIKNLGNNRGSSDKHLELLVSTLVLYELIGSCYNGLCQLETDKNNLENYKKQLLHYFNILNTFLKVSSKTKISTKFLTDSEWFVQYKALNGNSIFSFNNIIIFSSILVALISYYQYNNTTSSTQ